MALPELKTFEDLYEYAKTHGLHETATVLRQWVLEDQPSNFMPRFTSRAMCRAVSMGVEGTPPEALPVTYAATKYGSDLYYYMWGGEENYPLPEL